MFSDLVIGSAAKLSELPVGVSTGAGAIASRSTLGVGAEGSWCVQESASAADLSTPDTSCIDSETRSE